MVLLLHVILDFAATVDVTGSLVILSLMALA